MGEISNIKSLFEFRARRAAGRQVSGAHPTGPSCCVFVANMADQKRWFKLWCSAPADDDIQSLPPATRWAWAAFGAYTKEHGTEGRVIIRATNASLAAQMGVTLDALFVTIKVLPHVHIEESQNRDGEITVTWRNWKKYQEDSTHAERQKRYRARKRDGLRGEEKRIRRDEINKSHKNDSFAAPEHLVSAKVEFPPDWKWLENLVRAQVGVLPVDRFLDFPWWDAVSYTCGGLSQAFLQKEFAGMKRWLMDNPKRAPTPKGFRKFVAGWLERAQDKERRFATHATGKR